PTMRNETLSALGASLSFNHTPEPEIDTLSLHDALPIYGPRKMPAEFTTKYSHKRGMVSTARGENPNSGSCQFFIVQKDSLFLDKDRKSTRLNSSHDQISYAVFCLKKKKQPHTDKHTPLH